jgi:hypothetical protein
MRIKLDTVVNLVTLLTCAVVVALAARPTITRSGPPPAVPKMFQKGDIFPVFDGLTASRRDKTLLFVVRSGCRYCAESLPFYKRLTHDVGAAADLAVVTTDDRATAQRYLDENQLPIAQVASVPADRRTDLRIPGTPTLILVDGHRTIQKMWLGRLDAAGEADVYATLGLSARNGVN